MVTFRTKSVYHEVRGAPRIDLTPICPEWLSDSGTNPDRSRTAQCGQHSGTDPEEIFGRESGQRVTEIYTGSVSEAETDTREIPVAWRWGSVRFEEIEPGCDEVGNGLVCAPGQGRSQVGDEVGDDTFGSCPTHAPAVRFGDEVVQ